MATVIRLRREGNRNSPFYRVVLTDKRNPRDGKFIEMLGTYDPKRKTDVASIKLARIEHWLSQGAKASATVNTLIKAARKVAPVAG